MKSKFFKDTQGLDRPFEVCAPDKVSVCLRLNRRAYDYAADQAARRRMTSGEFIEGLIQEDMTRNPEGGRTQ